MDEKKEQTIIRKLFRRYHFKSDSDITIRFDTPTDKAYFIRVCAKHLIDNDYPLDDYYGGGEETTSIE